MLTFFSKKELNRKISMMYTCTRDNWTQKKIAAYSVCKLLLPVALGLLKFPFIGIYPCVAVYAIFRFVPMHCLLLSVGKMLKECVVLLLGDVN